MYSGTFYGVETFAGERTDIVKIARDYVEGDKLNFCSYPRAGSHWVLEMLNRCTEGIFKKSWREKINKTHSYHYFKNPVVYMYRHGKDCILSYAKMRHYKLAVQDKTYDGSFDAKFLKWIIEKEQLALHWDRHMSYYFNSPNPGVCYVRYEDFLVKPVEMLMVVMEFYGMDLRALDVDKVFDCGGIRPAQQTTFKSVPGITGYLPQLASVKTGRPKVDLRLETFARRYLFTKEWTSEINVMVDKVIKKTLLKHGYLP